MWDEPATNGDAVPDTPQVLLCQVRIPEVSTAQLAAARAHIDDLVRDLTMVAASDTGREPPGLGELAERLHALLTDLAPLRHGLHATALRALETHADQVTLELELDPSLAPAVRNYRHALDTADTYCERTEMLVCTATEEDIRFRRWYLPWRRARPGQAFRPARPAVGASHARCLQRRGLGLPEAGSPTTGRRGSRACVGPVA